MKTTWAFMVVAMLMAVAHAAPLDDDDDGDDDSFMDQALKRDADFRQDGFLAGLWDKVKGAASAAGKAALASLGEEFQALEKKNVRLNDALSRQNGFLAGLWDKVKGAASAAGKAALASLGEEEQAMLMREFQALEKENVRLNDDAMSRQNGFLAGLWDKVKGAASAAGKAALASLGEEERAMLMKELEAAKMNFRLNDDALSRQNGFLAGLWDKVKGAASAAGKAALASLGKEEQMMLMREFQALEKKNVRLNDDAMSRQNGFLAGLWDKVKGAASAAGKAALASLGKEEKVMLMKELEAAKMDFRLNDAMNRQNSLIKSMMNKVNEALEKQKAAGQAALSSLEEFQALEKKNVRLNDDAMSRQNGFLAGLWDKVKGAASAAGKAALASIGKEERAMLQKEMKELM